MTAKKSAASTSKDVPDNAKSSPMTYDSVNLQPRVIAGIREEGEVEPGLGPAAEPFGHTEEA